MIVNAYVIYDLKSLSYGQPFFAVNHATAKRIVSEAASDMNTSLGRHPQDYVVYCVGSFCNDRALIVGLDPKEHVADVISLTQSRPMGDLFAQKETV